VEKYGRVGLVTDDYIIRSMRKGCWITKARDTYSEHVIIICFSTATVVMRTHLVVYAHDLFCFKHSGDKIEDSVLLLQANDDSSMGHWIPTFRGKIMFLSSEVSKS
jgi:hypothetical protein